MNDIEDKTFWYLWDIGKAVFRGKFIALNTLEKNLKSRIYVLLNYF